MFPPGGETGLDSYPSSAEFISRVFFIFYHNTWMWFLKYKQYYAIDFFLWQDNEIIKNWQLTKCSRTEPFVHFGLFPLFSSSPLRIFISHMTSAAQLSKTNLSQSASWSFVANLLSTLIAFGFYLSPFLFLFSISLGGAWGCKCLQSVSDHQGYTLILIASSFFILPWHMSQQIHH